MFISLKFTLKVGENLLFLLQ